MLTQCPQCDTLFRLTAEQLRTARGMVRCGECEQLFNALDSLHEKPPVSQSEGDSPDIADSAATDGEDSADISLDNFIPQPAEQLPLVDEGRTDSTDPMDILIEAPSSATEDPMADKLNLDDLDDLPETLKQDLEAGAGQTGKLSIVLWSLGIFLLVVMMLTQLGISYKEELVSRYPASSRVFEQLCRHLPCETRLVQQPDAIKLVARDVRHHPRFRNTLLVNGTLINESASNLAYPVLQFELLDTNGTVIGVRQFQPAEYLDKSIALEDGMPPARPVHIVLEVLGASESAVSFEFSFM